jgi:predicted nucleotidyltransferase
MFSFEAGHVPGLFRLAGMELELSALLGGRKVDLNTPLCLSRYFRAQVLAEAEPVYAAA